MKLVYRGSRDGFKCIDFHKACDGLGNTLIIIKRTNSQLQLVQSEEDREDDYWVRTPKQVKIFGGFTTVPWRSCKYSEKVVDDSSFLFQIQP